MIRQLYIHAGLHKTGTTSIQRFLDINADKLRERDSLVLFEPDGVLRKKRSFEECSLKPKRFRSLDSVAADTVIVSQERYSWVNQPESLVRLQKVVSNFVGNTKVIFYLRRQDALVVSQKQQGSKTRAASVAYGHEPRALPTALTPAAERYLDFNSKIGMWADAFGAENIIVRVFERERLHEGDVVADFCSVIGLDTGDLAVPERKNESLSRENQLFLHLTRDQFADDSVEKELLVRAIRRADKKHGSGKKLLPSESEARQFYEQFRVGNRELNERLGITGNEYLFSEDFSMYPEVADEVGLSPAEMNEKFFEVIGYMARNPSPELNPDSIELARQLRDIALQLPAEQSRFSIELLELAHSLHPTGNAIRKGLEKFRERNSPGS